MCRSSSSPARRGRASPGCSGCPPRLRASTWPSCAGRRGRSPSSGRPTPRCSHAPTASATKHLREMREPVPLGGLAEGSQSVLQERGGQPSEGWTGWTSSPALKMSIDTMRSGPAPHSPGGIQRGHAPRDPWPGRGPRAPLLRLGTLPSSDDPRRTDRDEPPAPVRRTPTSPPARLLKGVGPHAVELRGTEHLDGVERCRGARRRPRRGRPCSRRGRARPTPCAGHGRVGLGRAGAPGRGTG